MALVYDGRLLVTCTEWVDDAQPFPWKENRNTRGKLESKHVGLLYLARGGPWCTREDSTRTSAIRTSTKFTLFLDADIPIYKYVGLGSSKNGDGVGQNAQVSVHWPCCCGGLGGAVVRARGKGSQSLRFGFGLRTERHLLPQDCHLLQILLPVRDYLSLCSASP